MTIPSFKRYLTEAALWQKSSGGGRKWDRYKNNKDLKKVDFEVERGVKNAPILDDAGNILASVNAGDALHILSNKEKTFATLPGDSPSVMVKLATGQDGWLQLNKIRNPSISTTRVEDIAHGTIRSRFSTIVQNDGPFTLYLDGQHKMENVVDIIQPKGDPKADFVILNDRNTGVGFISHKKAGGAKAYQQYGGISPRVSGLAKYGNPAMIREVDQFIQDVYDLLLNDPEAMKASRIYRKIKNKDLIGFSIFGPEYGSSNFSLDNVNIIGQGDPIIEPYKDGYNMTFSDSTHHNSRNLSWAMTGPYTATLIARNSPGENRKMTGIRNKVVVENRRGLIAPLALVTGRAIEI